MKFKTSVWASIAACAIFVGSVSPVLAEAPDQPITRYTFRNVARKVAPAVVNIKIKSNIVFGKGNGPNHIQIPPNFGFDDQMREYLEKLFEREMPNMSPNDADEYKYSRTGSGVIIRNDGYIVTSNHVVANAKVEDIEVSLPDGRTFDKIKMVGTDDLTDLAVLKIDQEVKDLPAVTWGESDKVEVGDFVVAIGNPLEFNNSVSEGIVSAKHRTIKKAPIEDLIQTTAMINPGNSGGALVDLDGNLIGINMAIATSTGMWSGLGFAIPSHTAKDVADQIIDRGKVARGYLGIDMSPLTTNLAQQLGYDQADGIVVKGVRPGSAADKAGLQRYDIIAKVGGKEIKEINDMHRNIGGRRAGEQVDLEVYRDEGNNKLAEKKITVTLGERPSQDEIEKMMGSKDEANPPKLPGKTAEKGLLGLQVDPRPEGKGLTVKDVEEGSRAALAGIQKGDAILEVNRQPVNSKEDLQKALKAATTDSHLFFIERAGTSAFVTIPAE